MISKDRADASAELLVALHHVGCRLVHPHLLQSLVQLVLRQVRVREPQLGHAEQWSHDLAGSFRAHLGGAQEKTIAELKGEFALDVIPTRHYGANSAWQQLSILAHNLIRSFQLDTLATPKPRSRKRTYTYLIRSMRTLRFLLVVRAGRLTRLGGRHVLRLSPNPATEALYASISHRLAA
jgi:hypothetical protein